MGFVREWLVAGGIVEGSEGILLLQNRRRNGAGTISTGAVLMLWRGDCAGADRNDDGQTNRGLGEHEGLSWLKSSHRLGVRNP